MANEITITDSIKLANNTLVDNIPTNTLSVNQNTAGFLAQVLTVTNTQTNLNLALITTLGFIRLQNLSVGVNFIQWGPISGATWNILGRMYSGEKATLRLEPGTTVRVVANTNSCSMLVKCYND